MNRERLGARSDFDEWANTVVEALKNHRARSSESSGVVPVQGRFGLRRLVSRMLTKIAA